MQRYVIEGSTQLGARTLLLTLRPKRRQHALRFFPGQYAALGFRAGGRPSPVRCFSIVSTPNQPDQLQFALRIQGNFTQALAKLAVGTEVFVYGPFGNFVIDEYQDKSVVLLAAGIGVTPFMSMIRNAAEINLAMPITLLYSCSSPDDMAFYSELRQYERMNPRFRAVCFVTRGETEALASGRVYRGRIDAAWLAQVSGGNPNRHTYFICGPKGFTNDMRVALLAQGTDAAHIITEEFTPIALAETVPPAARHGVQWRTYVLTGASLVVAAAFFMALDLVRLIPQVAAASAQVVPPTASAPDSGPAQADTSATDTQPPAQAPSPAAAQPTSNYRYTAPMTSVS